MIKLFAPDMGSLMSGPALSRWRQPPSKDVRTMSEVLQLTPVGLDGALTSWNSRRQLYWYDWEDDWLSDARLVELEDRLVVSWPPRRLPCSKWLDQGSA